MMMTANLQSWSVFIPCYNESRTLEEVVANTRAVMDKAASQYEIVIVDDGSTDDSKSVIGKLVSGESNVKAVFHPANYGIGAVQRLAYTTAKFENVIIISGDGQFNPDEILANNRIEQGTWLAYYRQRLPSYSWFRKFLSGVNRLMNRLLYDLELKDVNWTMAFKTDDLRKLNLKMNSTLLKSEACIKLNLLGYRAIEIPSVYHQRKSGKPKGASFKIIRQALSETGKLFCEIQRFKKVHLRQLSSLQSTR